MLKTIAVPISNLYVLVGKAETISNIRESRQIMPVASGRVGIRHVTLSGKTIVNTGTITGALSKTTVLVQLDKPQYTREY